MKIYIAARWGRQREMMSLVWRLEGDGHTVVSSWVRGATDELPDAEAAAVDLRDLVAADCLVAVTEKEGASGRQRGGRHVEFGIAMALGKSLFVLGPRENVFMHHSVVYATDDEAQLRAALCDLEIEQDIAAANAVDDR